MKLEASSFTSGNTHIVFSKKVGNIVIDTDLFEHAERQFKLEKDYDKKLYIDAIEPIKESDTKNDFFNNQEKLVL